MSNPEKSEKKKHISSPILSIRIEQGKIVLNNVNANAHRLRIVPVSGSMNFFNSSYQGSLLASATPFGVSIVNYPELAVPTSVQKVAEKKKEKKVKKVVKKTDAPALKQTVDVDIQEPVQLAQLADEQSYMVRVLLDQAEGNEPWYVQSDSGFMIVDPFNTSKKIQCHEKDLVITQRNGTIHINDQAHDNDHLYLAPKQGLIVANGTTYHGSILVMFHNNKRLLINCLDLEQYVACVLRTESWPGWPLEVNKVFAIACRTYAIAMVMRSQLSKIPYHIKNTNDHQTYQGHHTNQILKDAVEQTKGIFLAYDKKPIVAMFDGCCGGIITADMKGVNFKDAPYLARPYACTYCKSCKVYNWQTKYTLNQLNDALKRGVSNLKKIKSIKITKKDKAGLIDQVHIKDVKRTIIMPGKKFYALLKDVRSYCFSIGRDGDDFIFKGRGRGHHLGLCQWGAREMVRLGKDHREILEFYYPGINFMRLS